MKKSNRNLFIGAFAIIGIGGYLVYRFATKAKPIGMVVSGEKTTEEEKAKEETKPKTIVDKERELRPECATENNRLG